MKWKVMLLNCVNGELYKVDGKFNKKEALRFAKDWRCPEAKTVAMVYPHNRPRPLKEGEPE